VQSTASAVILMVCGTQPWRGSLGTSPHTWPSQTSQIPAMKRFRVSSCLGAVCCSAWISFYTSPLIESNCVSSQSWLNFLKSTSFTFKRTCSVISNSVIPSGGRVNEQRATGSIQRRSDRDHHHDHGVRDEGPTWRPLEGSAVTSADIPELRLELCLCRYLLEQSSPHVACLYDCDWCNAVGQSAFVVLAVSVPLRDRVDGGKPFHQSAYFALRRGAADGRNCVLRAPTDDHPRTRSGLNLKESDWARLEGQAVAG